MSMRQQSIKTAKYKISYREHLAVFNNEQMSTMQGDLYMAPDQTKTNVSISTLDQENERPYSTSRQKIFNKKETETNKDFDKGSFINCFSNNKWCTEQRLSAAVFKEVTIWYSYYRKRNYINNSWSINSYGKTNFYSFEKPYSHTNTQNSTFVKPELKCYSIGGLTKLSMDYAAIIWFLPVFYISLSKEICITYLFNMGLDYYFFMSLPLSGWDI